MWVKYSYMTLDCQEHPTGGGRYQADVADFKKFWKLAKPCVRCAIVWLQNGEVWIWQNERCVYRGGWQRICPPEINITPTDDGDEK